MECIHIFLPALIHGQFPPKDGVRDVFNKNKCYHPDDKVIIWPDDNMDAIIQSDVNHIIHLDDNIHVFIQPDDNINVIMQSDVNHIIHLDDNIHVVIQPDDNVYVIVPLDDNVDVII